MSRQEFRRRVGRTEQIVIQEHGRQRILMDQSPDKGKLVDTAIRNTKGDAEDFAAYQRKHAGLSARVFERVVKAGSSETRLYVVVLREKAIPRERTDVEREARP